MLGLGGTVESLSSIGEEGVAPASASADSEYEYFLGYRGLGGTVESLSSIGGEGVAPASASETDS